MASTRKRHVTTSSRYHPDKQRILASDVTRYELSLLWQQLELLLFSSTIWFMQRLQIDAILYY